MKNLKIYTDEVDELAQKQIAKLLAQPAFAGAKVRIMPDVHAGKGCVIGFTADPGDKVIPNIVGVDIGCGMLTVNLGKQKLDFAGLDEIMHRDIPSGMEVHAEPVASFEALDALHCLPQLERVKRLLCSLGSLGGGNHFVEVDADTQGNYYLVIHSGSRNLGKQVCEIYQQEAIDRHAGCADREELEAALIAELKAQGRQREIAAAIKAQRAAWNAATPDIPADLCYLEDEARARATCTICASASSLPCATARSWPISSCAASGWRCRICSIPRITTSTTIPTSCARAPFPPEPGKSCSSPSTCAMAASSVPARGTMTGTSLPPTARGVS